MIFQSPLFKEQVLARSVRNNLYFCGSREGWSTSNNKRCQIGSYFEIVIGFRFHVWRYAWFASKCKLRTRATSRTVFVQVKGKSRDQEVVSYSVSDCQLSPFSIHYLSLGLLMKKSWNGPQLIRITIESHQLTPSWSNPESSDITSCAFAVFSRCFCLDLVVPNFVLAFLHVLLPLVILHRPFNGCGNSKPAASTLGSILIVNYFVLSLSVQMPSNLRRKTHRMLSSEHSRFAALENWRWSLLFQMFFCTRFGLFETHF